MRFQSKIWLIMKRECIIIPASAWKDLLEAIHTGHKGAGNRSTGWELEPLCTGHKWTVISIRWHTSAHNARCKRNCSKWKLSCPIRPWPWPGKLSALTCSHSMDTTIYLHAIIAQRSQLCTALFLSSPLIQPFSECWNKFLLSMTSQSTFLVKMANILLSMFLHPHWDPEYWTHDQLN